MWYALSTLENATFWKFEIFLPGNVADFIVSSLKRPKSLIEGTPTINSRKDQPGRSPYRWVVLKSEEMRTRFMPWCTCLSSQDVLIQSHHVNLGDRAVCQCETCWLQNTRSFRFVRYNYKYRQGFAGLVSTVKLKPSSAQWDFGKHSNFSFQGA